MNSFIPLENSCFNNFFFAVILYLRLEAKLNATVLGDLELNKIDGDCSKDQVLMEVFCSVIL